MDSEKTEQQTNQERPNQQQQNNEDNRNNKPELTAEWTVHAQLVISRPSTNTSTAHTEKTTKQQFGTDNQQQDPQQSQNPVKVVYKWSSEDYKNNEEQTTPKSGSFRNDGETATSKKGQHDSFHSTTGGVGKLPSDSGFSGSNTSRKQTSGGTSYGARCRSTCSIVLSAVTDLLPSTHTEIPEEPDPYTFNTTASYTVLPDQTYDEPTNQSASQNFGSTKILGLRDAFSQTSDTEMKIQSSHKTLSNSTNSTNTASSDARKKRKPYDFRRNTESLLSSPNNEGNTYLPSYSQKPLESISSPTEGNLSKDPNAKKSPRTVHIDVYCTGSDVEDDDDDDENKNDDENDNDHDDEDATSTESSTSTSENPNELESNSTPQTVLDTDQMYLRHQRAGNNELPRRYQQQQQSQQKQISPQQQQQQQQKPGSKKAEKDEQISNLTQHNIAKSNTADEINESKQILFQKHIGDQRSNNKYLYRNRNFRKDQSDDNLSSNYPTSSHSTVRDMTWSSISSAMASNSAIYEDVETSWKETEPDLTGNCSLAQSDSFEYDNSMDRLRIQKMEHLWSLPEKDILSMSSLQHDQQQSDRDYQSNLTIEEKKIHDFFHSYQLPSVIGESKHPYDYLLSECDNISETDHSFTFDHSTIPGKPKLQFSPLSNRHFIDSSRKSETRLLAPSTSGITIEKSVKPEPTEEVIQPHRIIIPRITRNEIPPKTTPEKPIRILFNPSYVQSHDSDRSNTSTLQSNLSGYTNEYLAKARKFGAVVTALRKPGHHVGPAKNPECQCEHCRRWLAERTSIGGGLGRGRAYSTGDAPNIRTNDFWLKRTALH